MGLHLTSGSCRKKKKTVSDDLVVNMDRATDSCCFVGPQSVSGVRQELSASMFVVVGFQQSLMYCIAFHGINDISMQSNAS
jgi:hypothetical protein